MKKTQILSVLLLLSAFELANAHSHHTYIIEQPAPSYVVMQAPAPTPVIMVESEPPAEIEDEIVQCPGPNYVWIKGHWQWDGMHYQRVHGHWVVRPTVSAMWVNGFWTKHHNHWRWTEGYWQ